MFRETLSSSPTNNYQDFIFSCSVSKESIIDVFAAVSCVSSPIESCTMKNLELHVNEFWVVSSAKTHLPLLIEDAARKITQDEVCSHFILC